MYSLNIDLVMVHMIKPTYIPHGHEHRKSWKVDLTIYSIDRNTSDNDTCRSTLKMRTRTHIYSDHVTQVNFSSHEDQILKTTDDTPRAQTYLFTESHHVAQVNFSSHEDQILKTTDYTPRAQEGIKSTTWQTPPVFTNTPLSENLRYPTPKRVNQSSSTPVRDHENRMKHWIYEEISFHHHTKK